MNVGCDILVIIYEHYFTNLFRFLKRGSKLYKGGFKFYNRIWTPGPFSMESIVYLTPALISVVYSARRLDR